MPSLVMPAGLDADGLAGRLASLGRLRAGRPRSERRTLLDTFDWRLHRAGWMLEAVEGRHRALRLRPIAGGRPLAVHAGPPVSRALALPGGALRERLEPVVEPRALLPVAVLDVTVTPFTLRGPGGRAPLRLSVESALVGAPGSAPSLPQRPVLTAARDRRASALLARCASWPDTDAGPDDLVAAALAPLGRVPRDYTGKVRVPLQHGQPARDAARALLLHLLATLEANLPGVRADLDPEFLHDFRVAVRRSRSAIGQIKGVFPPAAIARFARGIGRLQELTGPARDLDVYTLELPALGALLPPRVRRSLGPLARLLERRRRAAHEELARALDEPWFARLIADWRAFLQRPTPQRPAGAPNARRPAGLVAAERLAKLHRRALREGGAIGPDSPPADLHELRKTCKKLRYLVEFFHALLERNEAEAAVESLKGLQDVLGRYQDLQVQSDALLGLARELAREAKAPPPAYLAMGMLVERLREQQHLARTEFAGRFAAFSRPSNRRRWKRLIAHAAKPAAADAPEAVEVKTGGQGD